MKPRGHNPVPCEMSHDRRVKTPRRDENRTQKESREYHEPDRLSVCAWIIQVKQSENDARHDESPPPSHRIAHHCKKVSANKQLFSCRRRKKVCERQPRCCEPASLNRR